MCLSWGRCLGLLLLVSLHGCQGDAGKTNAVDYFGFYHPPRWVETHPGEALDRLSSCTSCHDTTGSRQGTGIPTCQTAGCHHGTLPGFAQADVHGLRAKHAAAPSGGSLVSCQMCHGKDFKGGAAGVSCASCHGVPAPHPAKPWRGAALSHATTDPGNAPVCAQCHYPGSANNPAGHPATPPAAGASPSCFNNTLCHGDAGAPHVLGTLWRDPTSAAFHGPVAKQDLAYCQACHGTPGTPAFDGGATATACSSCHTKAKAHSVPWAQSPHAFPGYVASHRDAGNRAVACALCHDVTKGRTAPNPAAPSCYSGTFNGTGCHANGPGAPNHPVPFLTTVHTAVTTAGFNGDCSACHAVTGSSPLSAAPTCATCHQASSPLVTGSCASCHTRPPSGSAFPDAAGAHAKHDALAGVTLTCSVCHSGLDSGSQAHYDRANGRPGRDGLRVAPAPVAFLALYSAKSGAAAFDPTTRTCSNVSCHGGQTTPAWGTGTLNSATQCASCHTIGTTQYNSQNQVSGHHAKHAPYACTDCHAMTKGANTGATNHFAFLGTQAMEGPASTTIQFGSAVTGSRLYDPATRGCALVCHGETHTTSNNRW